MQPLARFFLAALLAGNFLPAWSSPLTSWRAACAPHDDFIARADPLLAPARPADCSVVTQTPPDFTWPPVEGNVGYTLHLRFPDGRVERRSSRSNWFAWPQALAPGNYAWRVEVGGETHETSEPRRFTIAPNATSFVVPTGEEASARAKRKARPRSWTDEPTGPMAALKSDRARGFGALVSSVNARINTPPTPEPTSGSRSRNYDETVAETKRALASAFAWAGTRNPSHGADGARRLMNLASWNTRGTLGFAANDMASRTIAWTLALGYDWMHDHLNAFQKATILAAIKARTQPMGDSLVPRIGRQPYDSHGNVTLTLTAAIAALMVGDIPEADAWMHATFPLAVVWTSPWGGEDGGFGNGTAQMFWDTGENLVAWYVLRGATGVDLSRKEWVRNLIQAMAYFVPPGAPAGVFGDGQEMQLKEVWSRVAKAQAAFAPSRLGLWYARQFHDEDPARLELLLAPRAAATNGDGPVEAPSGAVFPSIGWAAMHSRLDDRNRVSVYFRSSPYGSYNHSHADHNSFIVDHGGRRLAIASGYYDGYRTPHWSQWYKQTRAANAITYDDGQGQLLDERGFAGEIVRFEHKPGYDFVVGRAEKAYGGALTQAVRAMVYLRPNVVLVHDVLASPVARTWEWNIHALERMSRLADHKVSLSNGDARMCVEMLASPGVVFSQTDEFTAPPSSAKMGRQWHGRFATRRKSSAAEFIALMRIGAECSPQPGASVTRTASGWQVQVEGKTVVLSGGEVSVREG